MLVRTRSHAADGCDAQGRLRGFSCHDRCYRRGTQLYPLTSRISSVAMTCSACICESLS